MAITPFRIIRVLYTPSEGTSSTVSTQFVFEHNWLMIEIMQQLYQTHEHECVTPY